MLQVLQTGVAFLQCFCSKLSILIVQLWSILLKASPWHQTLANMGIQDPCWTKANALLQHPNTLAVEWAKGLEQLPSCCRDFISNPGSQDHLLTALTDCVLAVHRPNRSAAMAVGPLGGGNWQEPEEEVAESGPLASAPADPLFGSRKRTLPEFPGAEPAPKRRVAATPASKLDKLGYTEWDLEAFAEWMAKFEQGMVESLQEKESHAAILAGVPALVREEFGLPSTWGLAWSRDTLQRNAAKLPDEQKKIWWEHCVTQPQRRFCG